MKTHIVSLIALASIVVFLLLFMGALHLAGHSPEHETPAGLVVIGIFMLAACLTPVWIEKIRELVERW